MYHKFGSAIVTVANTFQARSPRKARETLDEMLKGTPIILEGVLHNHKNNTYGMPDIIIRSDWLNKIIHTPVIDAHTVVVPAPKLNKVPWHYRIIDIKLSTLCLRSNGVNLLNSGSMPAYKSQVYIYNQALGELQGYTPDCAYVLGRKWNYTYRGRKYSGNNCFDKLGVIDFNDIDQEYIKKTNDAVKWIREMREHGNTWSVNPPSREELYPNMSNNSDSIWRKYKEDIANNIKEITSLWCCGPKNRKMAHSKKIFGWNDRKCTAKALGVTGPIQQPILQAILDINRSKTKVISPDEITYNQDDWLSQQNVEFYVDFETVSDLMTEFTDIPESTTQSMIFMIGVGWKHRSNDNWNYKCFSVNELSITEEKRIFDEFYEYLHKVCQNYDGYVSTYTGQRALPKLYHWGNAEVTMFDGAVKRHYPNGACPWEIVSWFDFLKVMKNQPIVVKGALDFGLKSIAKAMKDHNMIESSWPSDTNCSNGMGAMVTAYNCYKDSRLKGISMNQLPAMKDITAYNEIDCKVVMEIIRYLRNK